MGQGNLPFLFVQISSFESPQENWGIIRDSQRRALAVATTGMAVTLDIGQRDNVHPPDKQTVGARLALAARALAYGETGLEFSGPLYRQTTRKAAPWKSGSITRKAYTAAVGNSKALRWQARMATLLLPQLRFKAHRCWFHRPKSLSQSRSVTPGRASPMPTYTTAFPCRRPRSLPRYRDLPAQKNGGIPYLLTRYEMPPILNRGFR